MELCENNRADSLQSIVKKMVSAIYLEQIPDDDMVALAIEV
jgi:hypothetical protein